MYASCAAFKKHMESVEEFFLVKYRTPIVFYMLFSAILAAQRMDTKAVWVECVLLIYILNFLLLQPIVRIRENMCHFVNVFSWLSGRGVWTHMWCRPIFCFLKSKFVRTLITTNVFCFLEVDGGRVWGQGWGRDKGRIAIFCNIRTTAPN